MNNEEKQEAYMELQMLDQKIKQLQKKMEKMEEQLMELNLVKNAVKDFEKLKEGQELQVPLANGIYMQAEVKDTKELLVNVGAYVMVSKTIPEVDKLLDTQVEELNKFRENIVLNLQSLVNRAEQIQSKLTVDK